MCSTASSNVYCKHNVPANYCIWLLVFTYMSVNSSYNKSFPDAETYSSNQPHFLSPSLVVGQPSGGLDLFDGFPNEENVRLETYFAAPKTVPRALQRQ